MKLDSRILEGKKPLDCFDAEIAKQFIGKKGLFGSHESQFMDLDTCPKCVVDELKKVDNYDDCPFISKGGCSYRRFLPAEWVKKEPEKYRQFENHAEYKECLEAGIIETWIQIREKASKEVWELMYTGGHGIFVCFGAYVFSLKNLFNDFELKNEQTGEWQPFGIEIEEK